MHHPQMSLYIGDPYRCECALAAREQRIREDWPDAERLTLFGEELRLSALETELATAPLFASGRHFVLRHAEATVAKPLAARLTSVPLPEGTFLTLVALELRETSTLAKAIKARGHVERFPAVKGRAVPPAVREVLSSGGVALDAGGLQEVVRRCGGDLLAVEQEMRKLRAFAADSPVVQGDVERLCFSHGEGSIYPMLDRLGERSLTGALLELGRSHEDPRRLLSPVLRHVARLSMVADMLQGKAKTNEIATALGVPPWLARRLVGQARCHEVEDLTAALDLGIDLDLRVKRGGLHAEDALMTLILATTSSRSLEPGCVRRTRPSPAGVG